MESFWLTSFRAGVEGYKVAGWQRGAQRRREEKARVCVEIKKMFLLLLCFTKDNRTGFKACSCFTVVRPIRMWLKCFSMLNLDADSDEEYRGMTV